MVVDDEDRENEGDLIFAASKSTPELMAFTVRYSSGVICVPVTAPTLDRLGIPLMTPHNRERMRTAYTVSVDARDGVTTGISAADRSHTVRTLIDSATEAFEVVQPGHVFPLRYAEGGVLVRPGPHRGRGRPGAARRPGAGRRDLRDRQRRRHDEARPAAAGVRRRARPVDDLDRAADPPPATPREPRASGSPRPGCRPRTATSPPTATGSPSTAPSTSRSCSATSPATSRC